MKIKIKKVLSKPKFVIPFAVLLGLIIIIFSYNKVGIAPYVDVSLNDEGQVQQEQGDTVNLSFLKSGRISSVSIKEGQEVKRGDILVKLNAPDQEGVLAQAKGNLDLAEAGFASLNNQYANTKKQQDLIVKNAYQSLLSSGLEGIPDDQTSNIPIISGTYTCGKEGYYEIKPYKSSDNDSGYSFEYSGLEEGTGSVKYQNSVDLGTCGLQIKFSETDFDESIKWTINIPNVKSATYLMNKNAYELAKENRSKVLDDLMTNIGKTDTGNSVAKATVEAARGAYKAALGAYENNLIISPVDGVVSFVDKNLIEGQSVTPNKNVISIIVK